MHPLISTSPPFPHGTWGATTLASAETLAPTSASSPSDNRTLRSALRGALLHESNGYHLGYGLGSAMNRWRDAEFARGQAEADADEEVVHGVANSWPRGGLHPEAVRRGGSYTDSHARGRGHGNKPRTRPMTPVLRDAARADMGEVDLGDCAVSRAVAWRDTAVGAAVDAALGGGVGVGVVVAVGESRGGVGVGVGVGVGGVGVGSVVDVSAGGVAGTHANVNNISGPSGGRSGSIGHAHTDNQPISNPNLNPNANPNPTRLSSTPSSHTYTSHSTSTSYRSHTTTPTHRSHTTRPALTPSAPDRALLVRCCGRHTAALAVVACEAFPNRGDTRGALDTWARTVQAERYRAAYTCALRAELCAAQESTSVDRASTGSIGDDIGNQVGAAELATAGDSDMFDLDISGSDTSTSPTERAQDIAELAETLEHTSAAQLAALAATLARFPLSELSPDPEAWSACAPTPDEVGAQARRLMADDEGRTAALALARALTLVAGNTQMGGGGYGVAMAGTRMARVVAVADNVLALEVVPDWEGEGHGGGEDGGGYGDGGADAAGRRRDRGPNGHDIDAGDDKGGGEGEGEAEVETCGEGGGETESGDETESGGGTKVVEGEGDGETKGSETKGSKTKVSETQAVAELENERSDIEEAETCKQTARADCPPGNEANDQDAQNGHAHECTPIRASPSSLGSPSSVTSHGPPRPTVLSLPAFLSSPTLLDRLPHDLLPAPFASDALLSDVCEHAAGSPGTQTLQLPAYDYPTPVIDSDSDSEPPPLDIGEAWGGGTGLSASPASMAGSALTCTRGERCVRTLAAAAVLHRPALQRYYDLLAAGLLAIGARPRIACLEHVPLARGERAEQVRAVADEARRGENVPTPAEGTVETEVAAVDSIPPVSGESATAIPRRGPVSLPLPRRTSSFTLFRNWILGRRSDLPEAAQQLETTPALAPTSDQDRGSGEAASADAAPAADYTDAQPQAATSVPERQTSRHQDADDMNELAPEVAALARALGTAGVVVVGVHPAFMDMLLHDAVARPSMWRLT